MTRPLSVGASLLLACVTAAESLADDTTALYRQLSDSVSVRLQLKPTPHFVVDGLDLQSAAEAKEHVRVTVHSSDFSEPPPVLGTYEFGDGRLKFLPRFALSGSVTYELSFSAELRSRNEIADPAQLFRLPAEPPQAAAEVTAIYPSSKNLPENLLKFYIHFSTPMSRGEAYRRIHLLEEDGETRVKHPFLELGEELWNADQTRFTLFIHPGRIKRGLRPREEDGPPMTAGKQYTLRIDSAWLGADGQPLGKAAEKRFRVIDADHQQLDPEDWKIETPAAETTHSVALVFDEPLDHAMLGRVLSVERNDGTVVDGESSVERGETKWLFSPTRRWTVGTYHIRVATILEDLCGNSIARPFEVRWQANGDDEPAPEFLIEFIVK